LKVKIEEKHDLTEREHKYGPEIVGRKYSEQFSHLFIIVRLIEVIKAE
jgi:hypothetical protein